MKSTLARIGGWSLAVLAAALPVCAAHAARVESARVWADHAHTRVVFDLSGPQRYVVTREGATVRLALAGGSLDRDFEAPAAQGLYRGLESRRTGAGLELVARVDGPARPRSFLLKPAGSAGYRLVLDLYPDGGADHPADTVPAHVLAGVKPLHSEGAAAKQAAALLGGERKVIVAVDAGHGGEDPGAHGPGGTQEKNVTLAVARALAAEINRQPGMKAVLTRSGDYFIPLKRRYQIAREQNADIFVSIHADSYRSGDAKGSSVWVLSPRGKTSEAARWLADRENRADLIGGVSLDDKDDSLAAVLLDMQQGWAVQASETVAANVLKALAALGPTHRGYVERANFVVLRSPDVPSLLVETAFISNPAEERKLRDPAHQRRLAEAITGGVKNYFESTPPPGTWFAAQAAIRNGEVARVTPATGGKAIALAARADDGVRDLHRVGSGESLSTIAREYGVSVDSLKSANKMSSDSIRAGTVLAIPAS